MVESRYINLKVYSAILQYRKMAQLQIIYLEYKCRNMNTIN